MEKITGDVIAGSINGNGAIKVTVSHGAKRFIPLTSHKTCPGCTEIKIQNTTDSGQSSQVAYRLPLWLVSLHFLSGIYQGKTLPFQLKEW